MALVRHLSEHRVTRLQAVFFTHVYPEHAGGFQKLWGQIPIDMVGWNGQDEDGPVAEMLRMLKPAETVRVLTPGQVFNVSSNGATLRVLANGRADSDAPNDHGLAFLLTDGKTRLLFPGDASLARQKDLAEKERKALKNVRFMMWPDHGNAASEDLLSVMPHLKVAVASVGTNHPTLPSPVAVEQASNGEFEFLLTKDGALDFIVSDDVRRLAEPQSPREP
jgi:beta-lactamase superfamily II metal-dependent hydrolase